MKLLTQGRTVLTALSLIAALAVSLALPAAAQTTSSTPLTADQIAARRALAKARMEESLRELQEATSNMMAQAEQRLAEYRRTHPALTAAQQAAQQAASAAMIGDRWQQILDAAQPFMRSLGQPEDAETPDARLAAQAELTGLTNAAQQSEADMPNVEAELDAISILLGAPRDRFREDGSKEMLAGQIDGEPIYLSRQNLIAGASISADELWPTNTAPWASASTGRNLSGTNVTLGLWEVDGGVLTNHVEFGSRARQVDNVPTNVVPTDAHATGVAGTMAANGTLLFDLGTGPIYRLMHGVANEATVNGYDLKSFSTERLQAAGGTVTGQPLRFSNHSYGLSAAWIRENIQVLQGGVTNTITNAWVWRGNVSLAEEWKYGFYTSDPGDGTGCTNIDRFLSQDATRHIMMYAAGNDRFGGPGGPTNYWYFSGPGPYNWTGVTNPPANSRVWLNGDGTNGGYDTVLPPGTSKNVLTVGAVRDVYRVVGTEIQYGYFSNASVVLAPFSGCGPTDDGRIKPDVVAVGQANPNLRNFGIVTPANNATNGYFSAISGTSFSAPAVTGGLGLAAQRRSQLFPNLDPNLDAWRGSTWRALAIHTADDVGTAGPDFQMGYGLFNAASAVAQVERDQQDGRGTHIKEFQLSVGQTNIWEVNVGTSPLRVTAAWSDPAGPAQTTIAVDPTTPMLVNNIDLRVERVGATNQFFPWLLNPDLTNKSETVRATAATTGVDNRNNVEQVYIGSPTPGRYRIVATHSGGLPGGLSPSSQIMSVLSSGDTPVSPVFTSLVANPSATQMLLTFTADPGAYFYLLTSTNLTTWQTNATVKADGVTNAVLVNVSSPQQFWRLRRQQ